MQTIFDYLRDAIQALTSDETIVIICENEIVIQLPDEGQFFPEHSITDVMFALGFVQKANFQNINGFWRTKFFRAIPNIAILDYGNNELTLKMDNFDIIRKISASAFAYIEKNHKPSLWPMNILG